MALFLGSARSLPESTELLKLQILLINQHPCIDTGEKELHGTNLGETISNNRGGIVAIDFSAIEDRDKLLKKIGQTVTLSGHFQPVKSTLGFYWTLDLEQKTGIRNPVQTEEEPRFHLGHGAYETAALKS